MKIKYGKGKSEFGPGVQIDLDGNEVAIAISAWLVAQSVIIRGPRTISVNDQFCQKGKIYVDPSGFVINQDGEKLEGRGDNCENHEDYKGGKEQ